MNGTNSVNGGQSFSLKSASSQSSLAHRASIDSFEVSRGITPPILPITVNLKNCINADHVSRAVTAKIIDLTNRTAQRISNEKQIADLLTGHLKQIDSTVRLVPFGSTTYGFGGANTNFNILIDSSKRNST